MLLNWKAVSTLATTTHIQSELTERSRIIPRLLQEAMTAKLTQRTTHTAINSPRHPLLRLTYPTLLTKAPLRPIAAGKEPLECRLRARQARNTDCPSNKLPATLPLQRGHERWRTLRHPAHCRPLCACVRDGGRGVEQMIACPIICL